MAQKNTHWADETAERIVRERGDKSLYTAASGITPSGTVHVGNFREIISVDLVVRALRRLGKNVRFIYSWDDFDVFRKVPLNMPDREALEKFLRCPITEVSDPWKRDESYARHHEVDVESVLPKVGIAPEYLYQAKKYNVSTYAAGIRKALENTDKLRGILDKFRDDEHKIEGDWKPVSVFCGKCRKDTTEITNWDSEWALSYRCSSCGTEVTVDLRTAKDVKLPWRVDWPMRWAHEGVDFEPAGKDHHSQGGSFDTSRLVCKEVYGAEAPVTFRYDFIGIKGLPGKMSSSRGEVVDLAALLEVYTPPVARYLFAGTRPNTEFTISFDVDVIKIYEDYDKTERIAFGLEKAKSEDDFLREKRIYELSQVDDAPLEKLQVPYQVSFRHLCNLVQIADGDVKKAVDALPAIKDAQKLPLYERGERALYWARECAPEDYRFKLQGVNEPPALEGGEREAIAALRDGVVARLGDLADDKAVAQAIYDTASSLNIEPKTLFRLAYIALIGKEQGPRLASFLRAIGKERARAILAEY